MVKLTQMDCSKGSLQKKNKKSVDFFHTGGGGGVLGPISTLFLDFQMRQHLQDQVCQ